MATDKQREEILFETKQINALKMKRNRYAPKSKRKAALQNIIDVAEKMLTTKRNKYGLNLK